MEYAYSHLNDQSDWDFQNQYITEGSVFNGKGEGFGSDGGKFENRAGHRRTGSSILSELGKSETELGRGSEVREDIYESGLVRTRGLKANKPTDNRWQESDIISVSADSVVGKIQSKVMEEYGIDTFVVRSEAWAKSGKKAPAYSKNGQIYLRENLSETEKAGYIPHEVSHVMKQEKYMPYIEFAKKLPEKVNMSSKHTRQIFLKVAEHRKLSGVDLSSKQRTDFWDEFNAVVYGSIKVAEDQGIAYEWFLSGVFYDVEEYLAEMDKLHEDFKRRK